MAGRAVAGTTIVALGVDRFGQSGDIPDLYRAYGIDTEAILAAAPSMEGACDEPLLESSTSRTPWLVDPLEQPGIV